MKISEFTDTLWRQTEVTLEGAVLQAHQGDLAATLSADLSRVLGPDVEIRAGWQTEAFGDDWSGRHAWWLVLDEELLEITITVGELGPGGPIGPTIQHRLHGLGALAPIELDVTYRTGIDHRGAVVPHVDACAVGLVLGDRRLSVRGEQRLAAAALHFGSQLQVAQRRARLAH